MEVTEILNIIYLSFKMIIGFTALFIVTKILGKTHIHQITPFEFISSVILGELVGNVIYDKEIKMIYMIYAVFLWGGLIYFLQLLTMKSKKLRNIFEGQPSIIIRNGKFDYKELKKNNLDISEVLGLIRQEGVFAVKEIEYGILEANGSLSVLKKSKYTSPTCEDLNVPEKKIYLPVSIVVDGEIIWKNIKENNLDKQWLNEQLAKNGIKNINEVLYIEWTKNEGTYIVKK